MQAKLVSCEAGTTKLQAETWFINTETEREAFVQAMIAKGFLLMGEHRSFRTREELQGQPTFLDICGPMYDGPGVVRYETRAANDILSF